MSNEYASNNKTHIWKATITRAPSSLKVLKAAELNSFPYAPWASYQIRIIAGCACAGNAGNVFPHCRLQRKPLVSDPDKHHGTCVTHVPWCMSGSLTRGGGENVSRHSRRMRNPQFYVSGKRSMQRESFPTAAALSPQCTSKSMFLPHLLSASLWYLVRVRSVREKPLYY